MHHYGTKNCTINPLNFEDIISTIKYEYIHKKAAKLSKYNNNN